MRRTARADNACMATTWNVKTTSGTIVVTAPSFVSATLRAERLGYFVLSVAAAL